MAYPSVPKTFSSQTTLVAGDVNSNFSSILSGVSSGSDQIKIYDFTMTSMNVGSAVSVVGTMVANSALEITGNTTMSDKCTINNSATFIRFGLGTYETNTTDADNEITPTKSYIALNGDTETDLETINADNFQDGDILIITKDPSSTADPVVKNGSDNIVLSSDRTLDSVYDRLVLIYDGTNWLELSFRSNA